MVNFMPEIPLSSIDRLLRKHLPSGTRIEKGALELMRNYLEEMAEIISRNSAEILRHMNRKTLSKKELELVLMKIKERYS